MLTNKTIVVTGGAGFLGRHLTERLERQNAGKIFVSTKAQFDLTEQKDARRLVAVHKPQIIIHLAASVGGIEANRLNPGKFFYENMLMGAMLMEEARLAGCEKFVLIGTVCSYPKYTEIPFKEEDLWSGYPEETNAPYGIAKRALLVQCQAYREQYGFNAIYLMPVNLYGPGDNFSLHTSHVIAGLIRKFTTAKENGERQVTLWGDGSPTREFLYVEDAACAIALAVEKYDEPQPLNLGSGEEISIRDLAGLTQELIGFQGEILWDTSKPNGQPRRRLDVSKARAALGFQAQVSLKEGLKKTISWFQENSKTSRMREYLSTGKSP